MACACVDASTIDWCDIRQQSQWLELRIQLHAATGSIFPFQWLVFFHNQYTAGNLHSSGPFTTLYQFYPFFLMVVHMLGCHSNELFQTLTLMHNGIRKIQKTHTNWQTQQVTVDKSHVQQYNKDSRHHDNTLAHWIKWYKSRTDIDMRNTQWTADW